MGVLCVGVVVLVVCVYSLGCCSDVEEGGGGGSLA